MNQKILLFDIDGTLLLTGGAGRIAFERAFHKLFHIPEAWGDLIPDGKTDPSIIEEISQRTLGRRLAKHEYSTLLEHYLIYFRDEIRNTPHFRLMPGVTELLDILSKRNNILMGLATGNLEEAAWLKLEKGNIRKFFSFGGFDSDSSDRSEITRIAAERGEKIFGRKVDSHDVYVIGDTYHDVRAAKKLGFKTVAVTTGSMKEDHFLGGDKPTYLMSDLSDVRLFLNILD